MSRKSGVRTAWIGLGSLFAVGSIGFSTFEVVSVLAHEEETIVSTVPADGLRAVEVRNGAGSTRIVGRDDVTEVKITARVSDGLRSSGHSRRRTDGSLLVEASCPEFGSSFCDVDYVIEVPSSLPLVASVERDLEVSGMDGGVDIDSDDGSVHLTRVSGDVHVRGDHGDITGRDLRGDVVEMDTNFGSVEVELVSRPRTVRAETSHGDVEVVVPDDGADYRLTAETGEGATDTPIRTNPRADLSITATADFGDVTVRYPE